MYVIDIRTWKVLEKSRAFILCLTLDIDEKIDDLKLIKLAEFELFYSL